MIKTARKRRNLTQEQLALRLNIDRSYVSKLENRSKNINPTLNQIIDLANVLGVDPHKLASWFINLKIDKVEFGEMEEFEWKI